MTLTPKAWLQLLQCPQTGGVLVWLGASRLAALNAAIARGELKLPAGRKSPRP